MAKLVLITYAQKPPINAHAGISAISKCLNLCMSLYLHPYFAYAGSKSSAKSGYINIPQGIRETLKTEDEAHGF